MQGANYSNWIRWLFPRSESSPKPTKPISPAASSNINTPLTPGQEIPTFDNIIRKIFSKSLIGSLASKDAVQNGVSDCIPTHNETRPKELKPYIRSHWRDLQRSGCVCIDVKIAIPNVFWEALIDDIYVGHPGTSGMICNARHCWSKQLNVNLAPRTVKTSNL